MKPGQILYTMLRACVSGMGVLILLVFLVDRLLPDLYGARQPEEEVRGAIAFLAALSYVCPNRWGVRSPVFYLRLAVMLLVVASGLQTDYRMVTGVYGPKRPAMYGTMIPMDIAMIAAPLLLVWKRHRMRPAAIGPERDGRSTE